MASYLQIENISKSYGPKVLFEKIGFNINEGDKIALIAPNGTGKTSLMRILAGKDKSDSGGKIMFLKDIKIAFLEQEYPFDPEKSIFDQIMSSSEEFTKGLDQEHVWEYERRVVKFLTNFNLNDPDQKMKELSGGEVKRVALTQMLATEAEFFIMDEPTNHLDIDAIEFLEGYLSRSRCTLLMVTHDRYFLDRVCNIVMEMDHGAVYTYKGNYQNYLEKREERIANYNAETDKVRNILRRELEWIRSTPCARTGKARYRINAFYDLKDRASQVYTQKQVSMEAMKGSTRLGTKIVNCKDLSFYYGDKCYLDGFTYNFQRYEKVGIVGRNGAGKSTFLNLITGNYTPDMVQEMTVEERIASQEKGDILRSPVTTQSSPGIMTGVIERGESLKIGYYHQSGMSFNPQDTVLDIVNDTWMLNRFLFPHEMLNNKIEKLSGGEKRRLYLLTILMQQPNLLILDEPTNDLDIVTLNILEEYLKEFSGSLIIVSHDRHFLDKLVDHLFIFCGDGLVKDFVGSYSEYREYIKEFEAEQRSQARAEEKAAKEKAAKEAAASAPEAPAKKRKLTYKEQKELEQLEKDLEALASEKAGLEESLNSGTLPYDQLQKASERIGQILEETDEKELRLLELYELQ
ncbi:MAG: ABC-F family ATP-binding cassette domain-containing protein [Bacteroidales bacterium]|nr:ABC-F family ATP-binding cassette domain-containing protein [Bacteroidales bacterium]MBQ9722628.1 ABC-F family ATP-binding cassette domain-containing protein [Bacteroidales bacterium]